MRKAEKIGKTNRTPAPVRPVTVTWTWREGFGMVKEHLTQAMEMTETLEGLMDHMIRCRKSPKPRRKKAN
jgi:hypothetical protein